MGSHGEIHSNFEWAAIAVFAIALEMKTEGSGKVCSRFLHEEEHRLFWLRSS